MRHSAKELQEALRRPHDAVEMHQQIATLEKRVRDLNRRFYKGSEQFDNQDAQFYLSDRGSTPLEVRQARVSGLDDLLANMEDRNADQRYRRVELRNPESRVSRLTEDFKRSAAQRDAPFRVTI